MAGQLKLHLGCGSTVVSGWENIDKSPSLLLARVPGLRPALLRAGVLTQEQSSAVFPAGIVHADVRKGLSYPDGSASFVYSSHMIEHMARWQALALMRECRRVLAPEGVLRLSTPDLAAVVEHYRQHGSADAFMASLGHFVERPGSRVTAVVQRLFTAPHQWLYDGHSLEKLLKEAGFTRVERREFRASELPDIELLEERDGSLFVEAERP